MVVALPGSSCRRVFKVLKVSRASAEASEVEPTSRREYPVNPVLAKRIGDLIQHFPTFGYQRLWAWLRFEEGWKINRKTVYRMLKIQHWVVPQRQTTPRPRARGWRSRATASNQRWAMDVTHIPCGADGWAHLGAVIDCHDREIIGYKLALRSRAKEPGRVLEEACLRRFGTLRPSGTTPGVHSDNGLIFQSRRFRTAGRDYRLTQEFITPYTPEQNGMIERFFKSLKEECTWRHNFRSFQEACTTIGRWIRHYNEQRQHQALNYQCPAQFRAQQSLRMA